MRIFFFFVISNFISALLPKMVNISIVLSETSEKECFDNISIIFPNFLVVNTNSLNNYQIVMSDQELIFKNYTEIAMCDIKLRFLVFFFFKKHRII